MREFFQLALALVAGGGLGGIFFGGLWYTVRQGLRSRRPALWFLVSLLLRMSVVLGGFYLVGHSDWRRLAACLAGFVVARFIFLRQTRPASSAIKEAGHAP